MGNQNTSGLHIGDRVIRRISGPVSMYYLKPSVERFIEAQQQGLNLPLLLLFGDMHRSSEMACESCTCDKPHDCCLKLSDLSFLKDLDRIAEAYPIDFSTESAPYFYVPIMKNRLHNKGFLFQDLIAETATNCHVRTPASTRCPTRFIRWQHVDSRFMRHTIEGYLYMPLSDWFNKILDTKKDQSNLHSHTLGDLTTFLSSDQSSAKKNISYTNVDVVLRNAGLRFMREFMTIVFEDQPNTEKDKITRMIDLYLDEIVQYRGSRKSVLFKQIDKLPIKPMKEVTFWKDLYKKLALSDGMLIEELERVYVALYDKYDNAGSVPFVKWVMDSLSYEKSRPLNHKNNPFVLYRPMFLDIIHTLNNFCILFFSITLDLYYIARLFKIPDNNIPPVLNVGFFGNIHTKHIVECLLSDPFGYHLEYSSIADIHSRGSLFGDKSIRCREIQKKIDLSTDLELYQQIRFSDRSVLEPYLRHVQQQKNREIRHRRNTRNNEKAQNGGKRKRWTRKQSK